MSVIRLPFTIILFLVVALLLAACGEDQPEVAEPPEDAADTDASDDDREEAPTVDADPVDWDLALYVGVGDPLTAILEEFVDDVGARTGDSVDITVRPAGELPYGADEYLRRVGDGSIAMADGLGAFVGGDCRIAAVGTVPLLIRDSDEWIQAWETLEPPVQECFESFGARALATYSWPSQNIWGSGDTPESLDDLSGLVMRQTGPETGELLTQLGVEPVSLTTPEVAGALQRGVVDGAVTSGLSVKGAGWDDDIDWGYIVNFVSAPSYIMVNANEWETLDPSIQAEVESASQDLQERLRTELPAIELEAREELVADGAELVEASQSDIDKIIQLMEDYWTQWAADDPDAQAAVDEVRQQLGR